MLGNRTLHLGTNGALRLRRNRTLCLRRNRTLHLRRCDRSTYSLLMDAAFNIDYFKDLRSLPGRAACSKWQSLQLVPMQLSKGVDLLEHT
jgi:hypothetical protein